MKHTGILLVFFFLLCLCGGCAHVPKQKRDPGRQLIELKASLQQKDEKIAQLEAMLSQQQIQLQEKDDQIKSLKERLAQFGVF